VAAADASPHLTMAAILAAAHYGIANRLAPMPPDHTPLPRTIFAALDALERGKRLCDYIPARFLSLFAAVKRAETDDLLADVTPIEHEFYL